MSQERGIDVLREWLKSALVDDFSFQLDTASKLTAFSLVIFVLLVSYIIWKVGLRVLRAIVPKVTKKTPTLWDDIIFNDKVIKSFAHLIPALVINHFIPLIFKDFPIAVPFCTVITDLFILIIIAEILISFLKSIKEILLGHDKYKDKPIGSYTQLAEIIVYLVVIILGISITFGVSPWYFISGLGAMAAVLMLVFKDTILGLVASIQLSANDMLRIGDWVTVQKYGADGDVIEINLATVKVQNFDKTITTIPTYAFISDSFRNWRGMMSSDGRRIKRSVHVKIDSVKYCSEEMVEHYKKYHLIESYLTQRQQEISDYNKEHQIDKSELINGRHLTNVGVFRKYVEAYLRSHPEINSRMTCMVRQLHSSDKGLPIEIYAFSADKNWVNYEGIVADIFDHIFAALSHFDLEVFEAPSGSDFREMVGK